MANTAIVFNVAKGSVAEYARLPVGGSKLTWVLLVSAGLEADATLIDYATLSTLLAASNDEATFTGYSEQDATSIVATPDYTNDWVDLTCANPSWSPTSAQALGKIILCYDPAGTHVAANMIPLFGDAFVLTTPTNGTITYTVTSPGFYRAS
jgi:hypothetical protein